MINPDEAIVTPLANIEEPTGTSLKRLTAIIKHSSVEKHGEFQIR